MSIYTDMNLIEAPGKFGIRQLFIIDNDIYDMLYMVPFNFPDKLERLLQGQRLLTERHLPLLEGHPSLLDCRLPLLELKVEEHLIAVTHALCAGCFW